MFSSVLLSAASLHYFCSVAHQEHSCAYCQCLSLFSHSRHTHMTGSDVDIMARNGGETLTSMLSTRRETRCTEKAHRYLQRKENGPLPICGPSDCISTQQLVCFTGLSYLNEVESFVLPTVDRQIGLFLNSPYAPRVPCVPPLARCLRRIKPRRPPSMSELLRHDTSVSKLSSILGPRAC